MFSYSKLSKDWHLFNHIFRLRKDTFRKSYPDNGKSKYADTLNLPKSDFKSTVKGGAASKREKNIQEVIHLTCAVVKNN